MESRKEVEKRDRFSTLNWMLLRVASITAILMFCYEAAKQLLFPHITIWVSHVITICFTTLLAVCAAYLVGRQLMKLSGERKQLQEQLLQAQKMEGIGRLAGGIAHDFNNLLTVIYAYSDQLLEHKNLDEGMAGNIREIKSAAERGASLTHQLLAFSRQQVLQPLVFNLNTVVLDLEKMLRRIITEDIALVAITAPELGFVKADRGKLEQVVFNLALNARDAMPDGGKLTLETANVVLDENYAQTHITVVPGRYVMLSVSDTGIGMDPYTQAKIFEPFFTTKEVGKGTGLGLATVYGIIKQSGGTIWVYSELGRGTIFKVYLPRVDELTADPLTAQNTPITLQGTETILLVEDDRELRKLAEMTLSARGYKVLTASSAAAAEQLCTQNVGTIDLLLTDIIMPGMNGWDLAQRLSQRCKGMEVVYMSGYTDNVMMQQGKTGQDIVFLQKPFTPAGLSLKVREVLDHSAGTK